MLALLNAVHVKQYAIYFDHMIHKAVGEEGIACRARHLTMRLASSGVMLGPADSAVDVLMSPWISLVSSCTHLKPRILVSAPSNTAVDNIIQRIMEKGFRDEKCQKYFPNILRIGAGSASSQVQGVTLEGIMETLLTTTDQSLRDLMEQIKYQMIGDIKEIFHLQTLLLNLKLAFNNAVSQVVVNLADETSLIETTIHEPYLRDRLPAGWELRVSFETGEPYWVDHINRRTQPLPPPLVESDHISSGKGYSKVSELPEFAIFASKLISILEGVEIKSIQCRRLNLYFNRREVGTRSGVGVSAVASVGTVRQLLESSILDEAHIVLTTLNGSGHPSMEGTMPFPVLVVDEAGQCTEPSVSIPFRRGCHHCILVGDPLQLPATIFSNDARALKYDRSLLERLIMMGCERNLLNIQYRMAPAISAFPSLNFYEGKLFDGENVLERNYSKAFHRESGPVFLKPFLFFNLKSSAERITTSKSRSNAEEVYFCSRLIKYLQSEGYLFVNNTLKYNIGIITPYVEQVSKINISSLHTQYMNIFVLILVIIFRQYFQNW